jgi:hypothetical protein
MYGFMDVRICNIIFNAFPRQQWLRERASMLRVCVHCLSYSIWSTGSEEAS